MKNRKYSKALIGALLFMSQLSLLTSCKEDINGPVLPEPVSTPIATGTALDANRLFGVWGATKRVGADNGTGFEQTYRMEFQSVADGEAVLSHWFTNGSSEMRDSLCEIEYTYTFDGTTVDLTPKAAYLKAGATAIKGVHIGSEQMTLYTVNPSLTDSICTLSRIGDPEPTIIQVDRTMPQVGERVTITGRNLQFVDHIYLPVEGGEIEVKDFTQGSRQIVFTVPDADYTAGSIRCQASSARVSCYSPAYMFCQNCVFMHCFNNFGSKSPYVGTEFEYTISALGTLRDNVSPLSSDELPQGHCLYDVVGIQNPDSLLSFFGDTPIAWSVGSSTDPSKGYLRFSSADRFQFVIDNSEGYITRTTRCEALAIQMDIYVSSNGEPQWNTGYLSYRLNKDQSSLTSSMVANVALWENDEPADFSDGWKTLTIPLTAFKSIAGDATMNLGGLIGQLKGSNLQTIIKLVNYPLDALHPAQALDSFQFSIANMRLVPYATPANTKE